ncbi:ubiquitin-like protein 7 [Dendronephthya gigantea]|uniref:ubiquitin-like protein 7 n=1 Tax=Dendronephthya gigantea TaxID=151771 RepID=UPI00106D2611|nr:ubiquitin-like protein 7 [Dendronephthya gigantea]
MPCIWIKEALTQKGNKFKLEDMSFNASVSELKAKLSESSGIDEKLHDVIYKGLLLKDDETLESYGVKEDATVYIIYRSPIAQDIELDLDVNAEDIVPVLQAAAGSPVYKDKMYALLKNPQTLENILATTPALAKDPVALSILKDPEILQNLVISGDISKLEKEHPALVQAASHIAADITKDISGSSRVRRPSNSEDDDFMDIEPEMLAQAELLAAHEEAIQNRENPGTSGGSSRRPITSSFLASALQTARANLVSTSTQTTAVNLPASSSARTSTSQAPSQPQPQQRISSEFFNQAMASALSANYARNTNPSSGNTQTNNWQSELRQLREMGIEDEALSLRALQATNGNVQAACDLIFEGGLD